MDNVLDSKSSVASENGVPLLRQILEDKRADLVSQYGRTLHDRMFTNRGVLGPDVLGRIASEEADALLTNLLQPARDKALRRGAELSEAGLSQQSLLGLGQATRQFVLERLHEYSILPAAFRAIDSYHNALVQGFIDNREKFILMEQERLRSAEQKALRR